MQLDRLQNELDRTAKQQVSDFKLFAKIPITC